MDADPEWPKGKVSDVFGKVEEGKGDRECQMGECGLQNTVGMSTDTG